MSSNTGESQIPDESDFLLRSCQRGDSTALSRLIALHRERSCRLALQVLGNAATAEEAVAHAFVAVWARARQWRGEASAGTWILRIVLRKVLDARRSERRWTRRFAGRLLGEALDRTRDPRPGPDRQAESRESEDLRRKHIQEALSCLGEDDRALVHLFHFEDLALSEIERILDVPKANLKMRLARARGKLRKLLGGTHET